MRIFIYSIVFSMLLNSYSLSDTRLEKDLKKLSKYNFFVGNEGNRYDLDHNIDKDKTIILAEHFGDRIFKDLSKNFKCLKLKNNTWFQISKNINSLPLTRNYIYN